MSEFVLNRDYVLRTDTGHSIRFTKGVPVSVPPSLHRAAVNIGAERVDGGSVQMLDDEPVVIPQAPEEREENILAAFDALVEKNDSNDFTAVGVPTVKAVRDLVNFKVERDELAELWLKRADT